MERGPVFLFVCSGNTCRSVMAEGLFPKIWAESGRKGPFSVSSAGAETIDRLPATEEALIVLAEEGVALTGHLSRQATEEILGQADYIFTMTRRQKELLQQISPAAAVKTWMLTEYAFPGQEADISDPYGQGVEKYRRTAKEIKAAMQRVAEKIIL
jgi:protein-tyrosine-phosphatase